MRRLSLAEIDPTALDSDRSPWLSDYLCAERDPFPQSRLRKSLFPQGREKRAQQTPTANSGVLPSGVSSADRFPQVWKRLWTTEESPRRAVGRIVTEMQTRR